MTDARTMKRTLARSLRSHLRANGGNLAELARELGTGRNAVRRILDETNTSITLQTMAKAARAVGLRLTLRAEPASPRVLGDLATKLSRTRNRAAARALKAQITSQFYGSSDAPDPA